ncbi:MAG: DNA-protecting protein DprA [Candidatus Levybacteria bacterium CG10_big_fil_rev_8_21_14_0_10_35_13]|nr:MAG: DNA-protecting protein DprA [Candidatus Levybacteria bacterium CG10_big_fil_rev_8_21_14_0_10_35_13]
MEERFYYLGFSNFSGIGPIKFNKLIKHFGNAKSAWKGSGLELEQIIGGSAAKRFEVFQKEFDIESYLKRLQKQKIKFVCLTDQEYPKLLRQIPNAPIILYIKGEESLLHSQIREDLRMIAIVGTRKITSYGREITKMFSQSLSDAGLIIVSGMAYGVDGVAHQAVIDAGGKTIAVLGNGVDLPYPRENQKLYEDILDSNGAVISEFPPGAPPSVGSFPSRNRIVAGLSDGILVTEGAEDSGSLITADYGFKFNRKVFAIPGPITSTLSAAPLRLIEKGAKLVISAEDILKELDIKSIKGIKSIKSIKGATKEEQRILEMLENESLHFDEIVRRLKIDSSKVGITLSMMEIKGLIKSSGGNYSLAP